MPKRLSGRFWTLSLIVFGLCALFTNSASSATDPVINEFVCNHTGTDINEFVEIFGDPSTDYTSLTILEIECDGIGTGNIDGIFAVGTTDGDGYWTTGFMSNIIENGSVTLLLVEGFSGNLNDDLDTDNDGVLDVFPFNRIVDDVAVKDSSPGDVVYSLAALSPGFDGNIFTPGGASRIPNDV